MLASSQVGTGPTLGSPLSTFWGANVSRYPGMTGSSVGRRELSAPVRKLACGRGKHPRDVARPAWGGGQTTPSQNSLVRDGQY